MKQKQTVDSDCDKRYAPLAQQVEHMTFNHDSMGSSPIWCTIKTHTSKLMRLGTRGLWV